MSFAHVCLSVSCRSFSSRIAPRVAGAWRVACCMGWGCSGHISLPQWPCGTRCGAGGRRLAAGRLGRGAGAGAGCSHRSAGGGTGVAGLASRIAGGSRRRNAPCGVGRSAGYAIGPGVGKPWAAPFPVGAGASGRSGPAAVGVRASAGLPRSRRGLGLATACPIPGAAALAVRGGPPWGAAVGVPPLVGTGATLARGVAPGHRHRDRARTVGGAGVQAAWAGCPGDAAVGAHRRLGAAVADRIGAMVNACAEPATGRAG